MTSLTKGITSCSLLQGALGLVLDKLLKLGQALAGALTMSLHCGVGTGSPTCIQPKPGSQFTILLGPGLGTKWRKKDVPVFFLLWYWWGLNL